MLIQLSLISKDNKIKPIKVNNVLAFDGRYYMITKPLIEIRGFLLGLFSFYYMPFDDIAAGMQDCIAF
jgi:hypothetical protein